MLTTFYLQHHASHKRSTPIVCEFPFHLRASAHAPYKTLHRRICFHRQIKMNNAETAVSTVALERLPFYQHQRTTTASPELKVSHAVGNDLFALDMHSRSLRF